MLYWTVIGLIFLYFIIEGYLTKRFSQKLRLKKENLAQKNKSLEEEITPLKKQMQDLEEQMAEYFFFYDLIRKIAPSLDKQKLAKLFTEEIRYLGTVEDVKFLKPELAHDYITCETGQGALSQLCIKTKSQKIMKHLKLLAKLLGLCVERIELYEKFQQLSVYDPVTGVYNRRYFMNRFFDEFERANNFSLNMSFLMLDIDEFKKINDTYGHLVGDAVLKEVANLVKENIREIDFVSRVGGEEFAFILLETDKTNAIIVAERICSKIFETKIRVFDETLRLTVSIGVASFPQNTLYPDVLMEVGDKALYKAKLSGKNRVC
jgi:diguanylate cyclase (GGDEF)-like protein